MTADHRRPALPPRHHENPERSGRTDDRLTRMDKPRLPEEPVRPLGRPSAAGLPARPLPRRTAGAHRRPSAGPPKPPDKTKRRFIQLVICLAVFGAALLMKIIAPDSAESIKRVFADSIGGGLDYKAAFASVGQALAGGGHLSEVWEAFSAALFNADAERPPGQPDGVHLPDEMAGGAGENPIADEPDDSAYSTVLDIEEAQRDELTSQALSAAGPADARKEWPGFVTQLSGWEVSLSEADVLDDTPPIPFGLALPVNVDYARSEISFESAVPVFGSKTSDFGYRDHPITGDLLFHYGLDIAVPTGTGIRCFADGVVTATGESPSYGRYVKVGHDGGLSTFYAHCSRILTQKGQNVQKGDIIAQVGMTGWATGPHLHFEVHRGDTILNPNHYITPEAPV